MNMKVILPIAIAIFTCVACTPKKQPTNLERGYNQPCYATNGYWYYGDPFAPVSNDQACHAHGVTPLWPQD